MAQFPDIPPTGFKIVKEDNAIKSQFEYGYVQTRRKYTKARRIITYDFKILSQTEADQIMTFYDSVGTYGTFDLALPQNMGTVTVRFDKPVQRQYVTPNTSAINGVTFREV